MWARSALLTFLFAMLLTCGCSTVQGGEFSPHPAKFDSVPLVRTSRKTSKLQEAVRTGATNDVIKLLHEGEDVNKKDYNYLYSTPLLTASKRGDIPMVVLLLKHGADINAMNAIGESALHLAIEKQNLPLVEFLIKKGIDVNLSGGRTWWTPLHTAVYRRKKTIVALLIDSGADVTLRTNKRKTPLDLAVVSQQKDVEELIRKAPTFRSRLPVSERQEIASDAYLPAAALDETNIVTFARQIIAEREPHIPLDRLDLLDIIHVKTKDKVKESLRVTFLRLNTKSERKYEKPKMMSRPLRHGSPLIGFVGMVYGEQTYRTLTVWIALGFDPKKSTVAEGKHTKLIWK